MNLRLVLLILTPALGLFTTSPNGASAWNWTAHSKITRDALSVLPSSAQQVLQAHLRSFLRGSVAPDREPGRQPQDHSLNPDGTGAAAFLLQEHAKEAEDLIRQKAPWSEIAFAMGKAAHMIQDLNQPQHTEKGEGGAIHRAYESVAYLSGWPRPGTRDGYDGFDHIKNYVAFAHQTASWSRQYFGDTFGDEVDQVVAVTWNHAVNDVADLWLSILMNAKERGATTVELPAPLRVQKQKRGCLLASVLKDTRYAGLLDSLRRFRDRSLRTTMAGRYFINGYYRFSVVALKTAKALGLTIPPSVLVRADKVIE